MNDDGSMKADWPRRTLIRLGIVSLVVLFLVPAVLALRERARRSSCASGLACLGKTCVMYSMDHHVFPSNLASLYSPTEGKVYITQPKVFICSGSGHVAGSLSNVDAWSDYVYVPPATMPSNAAAAAAQVLAYCPPENHKGKGAIVLYFDGSVSWLSADKFRALASNLPVRTTGRWPGRSADGQDDGWTTPAPRRAG